MRKILLAILLLTPLMANAQNAILQNGPMTKYDIGGFIQNHTLDSASKMFTDEARGFNPFHVLDSGAAGVCSDTARTDAAYNAFCLGHDANGNGLITLDSYNGQANGSLGLRLNGTTIATGTTAGLGLLGAPTAPTPAANDNSTRIPTTAWTTGAIGAAGVGMVTFEATSAALAGLSTATTAQAIRGGVAALGDAGGQLFTSALGTCAHNDTGSCVNSVDGKSWLTKYSGAIDAAQFNIPAHGSDGTAGLQRALDAGYNVSGMPTRIQLPPYDIDFTTVTFYPNEIIVGAGLGIVVHRTAVGPGFVLSDQPGHAYRQAAINQNGAGPGFEDVNIDGGGRDGTNILFDTIAHWHYKNLVSTGSGATGATGAGTSSGTTLTVSAVYTGAIKAGMIVECSPCGLGSNNYATVLAYGTNGTSGTGSTGTYALSNAITFATSHKIGFFPIWSWTGPDGARTLPSANLSFIGTAAWGGVFDGAGWGGYFGGTIAGGPCGTTTPVGILMDTTAADGTSKFNQNQLNDTDYSCNHVGMLLNNGADNWFTGAEFQNDGIGAMAGMGAAGASNNAWRQPYNESNGTMGAAFVFGSTSSGNSVRGSGSTSGMAAFLEDNGTYNCYDFNNRAQYCGTPQVLTFDLASFNNKTITQPSRYSNAGFTVVGASNVSVETAAISWGTGNVAYAHCGHGSGSVSAPSPVLNGDIICAVNGFGQYDSVLNHFGDGAEMDIFAGTQWTASNYESGFKWSVVANGATTPTLAMTLGSDKSLTLAGSAILAPSTAIATNATSPFAYLPTSAGAPTGVPAASAAGRSAVQIDSTNHKICWYENAGGAWKCAAGT